MTTEVGFRVPMVLRWPGKVAPNQVINGVMSHQDWFPTFVKAAGYKGDIAADLKKGKEVSTPRNAEEYHQLLQANLILV
jgi:arylsulfatase A-like enzyme